MMRLNVYLRFGGNAGEAMEFYKDCLEANLTLMKVKDSPMAAQMPPQSQNHVMHALLEKTDMLIMASDTMERMEVVRGNTNSLCINGDNLDEMKKYYSKLSQGAQIITPLKEEFFGMYGEITDKFGINWMFQSSPKK
jgi:PhnB protein